MTVKEYFKGDDLAADVWLSKYANEGEETPKDMHTRMAKELGESESKNLKKHNLNKLKSLSEFGYALETMLQGKTNLGVATWVLDYLDGFRYIVPQGSIMTMLGNKSKIGSLSNCFVIPPPIDSYGGILRTDQQLVQLMKRRGGVGTNLNTLRCEGVSVSNAAGTSTGAYSFANRYSNSTREVAQNGRRGALMLLLDCRHPDIFKFVNMKKDRTKVTGANISVMLTDEFMEAVNKDEDFLCEFPVKDRLYKSENCFTPYNYNELTQVSQYEWIMRIKARELFDLIVENAWDNAEPGVAFIDRVKSYCPDGVYPQYVPIASNPCGEQWMQAYDACRLLAINLFSVIDNPFTDEASIDWLKLYEICYIQQRLADDIVDLEIEYVDRIIKKIEKDPEDMHTKMEELLLWKNIKNVAKSSRRTGCGFTALGDMLAALGLKYDSEEALEVTEKVMKTKMRAELDCTIDLAILRGTFEGWDKDKEYAIYLKGHATTTWQSGNDFYQMLVCEFPDQVDRMVMYGRRNVSWSTVAPTGTVSIMTQTTSGLEPLFLPFYMRRKKINPSQEDARVDFTDQNGDKWQEFPVLHPKFKDWIINTHPVDDFLVWGFPEQWNKQILQTKFEKSPWFGSCANDISWESRIEIQAVIQKYTTNAISSTLNLPKDVSKETVAGIYKRAWEYGLKGVTIYRDGCRSGVLVNETNNTNFNYVDAVKRPKEIDADLHITSIKGKKYAVIIGKMEGKPYEIFAFQTEDNLDTTTIGTHLSGKVIKKKKGAYDFTNGQANHHIKNLQIIAETGEEQILTRLASGMLRHGAKPQFVMEQIDKCDLEVVSFSKALSRILKKYVRDEDMVARNSCKDCGSKNVRMQEGCLTCLDCGSSKCG